MVFRITRKNRNILKNGGTRKKSAKTTRSHMGPFNIKTLTPYTKDQLEKLDRHVYQSPNFIEQQQDKIDNSRFLLDTNHPKFMCATIEEKYDFVEKWLKSFFNKFQANNPDMYIQVKWKTGLQGPQGQGIKITNNQHIEVNFKERILEGRTAIAKLFLKFIAQGKVSIEGGQFDGFVPVTGEDIWTPILVVHNFDDYRNIINETFSQGDDDFVVTHYSISLYIPGSPHRFSINYLNIDNIENDIHIIKNGINVLKNQIARTCSIRSSRMNMF